MLQVSTHRRLAWVIAALMVVALPGAHSAFAAVSPAATKMLSAQLPAGVPMSRAMFKQTDAALGAAVAKRPDMAVKLVEAAIAGKSSKYNLDCPKVRTLVKTASDASPGQARQIMEAAMSMMPDCANELSNELGTGFLGSVGDAAAQEASGFGAGLGGTFPGSPGFIGSAPSGAFAFPPVVVGSLTNTTNN